MTDRHHWKNGNLQSDMDIPGERDRRYRPPPPKRSDDDDDDDQGRSQRGTWVNVPSSWIEKNFSP